MHRYTLHTYRQTYMHTYTYIHTYVCTHIHKDGQTDADYSHKDRSCIHHADHTCHTKKLGIISTIFPIFSTFNVEVQSYITAGKMTNMCRFTGLIIHCSSYVT